MMKCVHGIAGHGTQVRVNSAKAGKSQLWNFVPVMGKQPNC